MACDPNVLKNVPLFALLDDEEIAVLASQVEFRRFAPRERIYKIGDVAGPAYVMVSGKVQVTTVDEDQQQVVVDEHRADKQLRPVVANRANRIERHFLGGWC